MALGLTQPLTEMIIRDISWGQRRPVRRADNLTTFMCRLSLNLGASAFWQPLGLSRPVWVCFTLASQYKYTHYCCVATGLEINISTKLKYARMKP